MDSSQTFLQLRDRRRRVSAMCDTQMRSLQAFHYGEDLVKLNRGTVAIDAFGLNPLTEAEREADAHLSISSTATCVRALMATPGFANNATYSKVVESAQQRFEDESLNTRGLDHGNVYTLGQLLPALKAMMGSADAPSLVEFGVSKLKEAVQERGVRVAGQDFPPNGYLTYWALLALQSWGELDEIEAKSSLDWSQSELYRQVTYFAASDDEADAYQLGYNLLIQRRFRPEELKDSVTASALAQLFDAQLPGGLWEKKDPLFRYGDVGDAHPFTFELLNAIHTELADDAGFLEPHEAHLERAVEWAARNAYGSGVRQWRSGHLATTRQPESWATAEIYFFLQNYRAHLAERILRGTLREVGRGRPARAPREAASFADLYQPAVKLDGETKLVGELLEERMLSALLLPASARPSYSLARQPGRSRLARSGIFFGPPGTGKTTYAKAIADYLGWPLVTIGPADFAAEGMLQIPVVGRRLFDRLLEVEDTVIFFDEMEELLKKRDKDGTFEQRFLTTSFLPALQDLRDEAKTIYLVATNNFESLDEAARAPRRFDFQLQILPPAFSEKLRLLDENYRDSGDALPKEVVEEVHLAKDKLELATLKEMFAITAKLSDCPGDAREILAQFTPGLADRRAELLEEERANAFEAA